MNINMAPYFKSNLLYYLQVPGISLEDLLRDYLIIDMATVYHEIPLPFSAREAFRLLSNPQMFTLPQVLPNQ